MISPVFRALEKIQGGTFRIHPAPQCSSAIAINRLENSTFGNNWRLLVAQILSELTTQGPELLAGLAEIASIFGAKFFMRLFDSSLGICNRVFIAKFIGFFQFHPERSHRFAM
ncbi:MAG: hypothetical protein DRP71_10705 [Verrucomicrobia bacterium]|nr:MAG: hypothetical protein DRP71_10705 [Verrucomicrobiota bacterium]